MCPQTLILNFLVLMISDITTAVIGSVPACGQVGEPQERLEGVDLDERFLCLRIWEMYGA